MKVGRQKEETERIEGRERRQEVTKSQALALRNSSSIWSVSQRSAADPGSADSQERQMNKPGYEFISSRENQNF